MSLTALWMAVEKGCLKLEKGVFFFVLFLPPRNSTTPVNRLCLVLQLSLIHLNVNKLQYQTQPLDTSGSVAGKRNSIFKQPLKLLL